MGEWAWEQFLKSVKEHDDNFSFKDNMEVYAEAVKDFEKFIENAFICPCDIFIEFAVACLGKTECEKRLKEL